MTTTKILLGIIAVLSITCGILWGMISSRDRIILEQARSIEAGAKVARQYQEHGAAFKSYLDEERRLSLQRIARIEELKAQLNAPRPTRPQPRSKRELRDSFHRALDAR